MENSKITNLPILKHFEADEIGKSVDSFRKGEKGLFNIIKLVALVGVGYLTWVYVLPPVFKAIGQFLAVATTGILIVALVLLAPVILKGLRRLTRFLHKMVIKHDPFAELEDQKLKMEGNKKQFQKAKGKISALKTDMEVEAKTSEDKAEALQDKILHLNGKAKKLKEKMDGMVAKDGAAAKGSDAYVNAQSDLMKTISEGERRGHELKQEQDFVRKYGSRAKVMKKFSQKLLLVETSMDIKIADFDATIDILKKDYEFAQKSREATDTAKSAMLFTEGWELEYALDVVTTTIAEDIAITAGNLHDIDTLTATYAMDSDELYSKLDNLADDINTGKNITPSAKAYSNPDYEMTHEDKLASGGFDKLF